MSIFIDGDTKLVVQGITGRDGSFHTKQMIEYGTCVVAGVTPGKGGQRFEGSVPIFNTVAEAVSEGGANASVIYVPARFAADAVYEAADAGVELIVCITEGIPVQDMSRLMPYLAERQVRLIGANCPGAISPGRWQVMQLSAKIGATSRVNVTASFSTAPANVAASNSIGIVIAFVLI